MSLRSPDTHECTLYRQEATGETDSLGDPTYGWVEQWTLTVSAYQPAKATAGGTDRTRGGLVTDADMVAFTTSPQASDIDEGEDHAVLEDAGTVAAFVVDFVRELRGRYGGVDEYELHLKRDAANDVGAYRG